MGQVVWVAHPHTPAVQPPPQVLGAVQEPQSIIPLQPSDAVPQFCPPEQVVAGWQTHVPELVQLWPGGHDPQSSVVPQPSDSGPHTTLCSTHVVATQASGAAA